MATAARKKTSGIGHHPVFIFHVYLRRSALGNERDAAWCFASVGVDYGDEVLGVAHLLLTSDADSTAADSPG